MREITCAECAKFTRDKVGLGSGIGSCIDFDAYVAKKPSPQAWDAAFKKIGGKALYPDAVRNCVKFKRAEND